jgi:diacylglycerol kinase family enzyme
LALNLGFAVRWIIVNRRARRLIRPGPLLDALRRPGFEVVETSSLAELEAAAARVSAGDVVVLAGGDGSYMAGVSALADREGIRFALAPGGTVGTVARNWGVRGDAVASTKRLLDVLASDRFETTRRPTLRVKTPSSSRIGFIFGAGLVAKFFELYESRGAGGNLAAARIVARVFAGSFVGSPFARSVLDPVPCKLDIDGLRAPFDRVSLVCASVVRDLGLGMRLLYRAGEELHRFHIVATPLGPSRLGPQMPRVMAARPLRGERVDALAGHVRLDLGPDGAYVLDGDLLRAPSIELEAGPAISVLKIS